MNSLQVDWGWGRGDSTPAGELRHKQSGFLSGDKSLIGPLPLRDSLLPVKSDADEMPQAAFPSRAEKFGQPAQHKVINSLSGLPDEFSDCGSFRRDSQLFLESQ